jgi:hypothetical protein
MLQQCGRVNGTAFKYYTELNNPSCLTVRLAFSFPYETGANSSGLGR